MANVHLVDTMTAWLHWEKEDRSEQAIRFRKSSGETTRILATVKRCAACGKRIPAGTKVYMVYVSWGRKDSECDLRPIHTQKCIPFFRFRFTMETGEPREYSTITFNQGEFDVEVLGEPDARTLPEAKAWAEMAHRMVNEHCAWVPPGDRVKSYSIFEDDVPDPIFIWEAPAPEEKEDLRTTNHSSAV